MEAGAGEAGRRLAGALDIWGRALRVGGWWLGGAAHRHGSIVRKVQDLVHVLLGRCKKHCLKGCMNMWPRVTHV